MIIENNTIIIDCKQLDKFHCYIQIIHSSHILDRNLLSISQPNRSQAAPLQSVSNKDLIRPTISSSSPFQYK